MNLLVLSNPAAPHLKILKLPESANVTVGADPGICPKRHPEPTSSSMLCGMASWSAPSFRSPGTCNGSITFRPESNSALFPELIESQVPLTNAAAFRGLAGRVRAGIGAVLRQRPPAHGAKPGGRPREAFDVEMLAGRVMGVVGYGEIGRAAAKLGHALGMRV